MFQAVNENRVARRGFGNGKPARFAFQFGQIHFRQTPEQLVQEVMHRCLKIDFDNLNTLPFNATANFFDKLGALRGNIHSRKGQREP
ncbi:hypothetical protein L0337_29490 [candidate division KSB1 bacterium]|nr:hypothetical protein [candidate division KSB1 bacterium]